MTALSELLASLRASVGRDSFVGPGDLLALAEIVAEIQPTIDSRNLAIQCDDLRRERDSLQVVLEGTEDMLATARGDAYKQTETIERLLGELESVTRERDQSEMERAITVGMLKAATDERDAARASLAATEAALNDSRKKAEHWQSICQDARDREGRAVLDAAKMKDERDAFAREVRDVRVVVERETAEMRRVLEWMDRCSRNLDADQRSEIKRVLQETP